MAREIDSSKSVEERNEEIRQRGRERRLQRSFAENYMGGLTLSEALRSPEAQRSTRVRRRIKEMYKSQDALINGTGLTQNFSEGIDSSNKVGSDKIFN